MCSQWWTCCVSRGGQRDRSNTVNVQLRFLGDEEEEEGDGGGGGGGGLGGEDGRGGREEGRGGYEGGGGGGGGVGGAVIVGGVGENYALPFQGQDVLEMKSRRKAKVIFS